MYEVRSTGYKRTVDYQTSKDKSMLRFFLRFFCICKCNHQMMYVCNREKIMISCGIVIVLELGFI